MKRTVMFQVHLTPYEHTYLKHECKEMGLKIGQVMRKSTMEYLKRMRQMQKGGKV